MIPNLNQGNMHELIRRIESLERANPLAHSSLGRGRMRFYAGSELLIENGALNVTGSATIAGLLDVTGTASISGILNVSGHTTLSGDTTIAGPTGIIGELTIAGDADITGATSISGDTDISGALNIDGPLDVRGPTTLAGATSLSNDLTVTAGGSIKAGSVEILPDGGGQIALANGAITSDGFGMGLVNTIGIQISSPSTRITNLPDTSVAVANLHVDSSGKLWRVV